MALHRLLPTLWCEMSSAVYSLLQNGGEGPWYWTLRIGHVALFTLRWQQEIGPKSHVGWCWLKPQSTHPNQVFQLYPGLELAEGHGGSASFDVQDFSALTAFLEADGTPHFNAVDVLF